MYPPSQWTQDAFGAALAVVLAHSVYLPSAQCFALLPLASHVARRSPGFLGDGGVSATLDYDPGSNSVVLLATTSLVPGQLVVAADSQQRNSAELLLSGVMLSTAPFPGDTLTWSASLLATDRLYSAKVATLEAAGLAPADQVFPVCAELGMPTQLLSYLRMSRITDTAELMKVSFDQDGELPVCACAERGRALTRHSLLLSDHLAYERVRGAAADDGRLPRAAGFV